MHRRIILISTRGDSDVSICLTAGIGTVAFHPCVCIGRERAGHGNAIAKTGSNGGHVVNCLIWQWRANG